MQYWRPRWQFRTVLLSLEGLGLSGIGIWLVYRLILDVNVDPSLDHLGLAQCRLGVGGVVILGTGILALGRAVTNYSLRYTIDRNAITVLWLGGQQIIPLNALIQSAPAGVPTHRFGGTSKRPVELATNKARYLLGIDDADGFLASLKQRRSLGVVQALPERINPRFGTWYRFTRDTLVVRPLIAAQLLWLLGLLVVCWRYAMLPPTIVLWFDPLGGTLGPRPRAALLQLPLVGLVLQPIHVGLAFRMMRLALPDAAQLIMLALVLFESLLTSALLLLALRSG